MPSSTVLRGPGPRPRNGAWLLLGAALVVAGSALVVEGCAGPDAKIPQGRIFPDYTPSEAILFDDVIAPALFGFDSDGRTPASDPKLRDRTRLADFVIPARVESLTRVGGAENEGSYEITLAPTGPALAGDHEGPIVLEIPVTAPSYNWVSGAGAGFAGVRLLLFARSFREGDSGGTVLHFRAEPDTADMRRVVQQDAALRLLK